MKDLREMADYVRQGAAFLEDFDNPEEAAYIANAMIASGDAWLCCAWVAMGRRNEFEPWFGAVEAYGDVRFSPILCQSPPSQMLFTGGFCGDVRNLLWWLKPATSAEMAEGMRVCYPQYPFTNGFGPDEHGLHLAPCTISGTSQWCHMALHWSYFRAMDVDQRSLLAR